MIAVKIEEFKYFKSQDELMKWIRKEFGKDTTADQISGMGLSDGKRARKIYLHAGKPTSRRTFRITKW